jgi:adenylate kinase family enzyme
MSRMKKIVIIGSPGAGKSTLARRLMNPLGIEVFHLDCYFWEPGWKEKSIEARIKIQQQLVQGERWIIEGTYLGSSDERLNAADTIIFLDMPFFLCLWRVIKRRFKYNNKPRPDLPEGCPEKLHFPYILKVLAFPLRGHRLFFKKYKEIQARQRHKEEETTLLWFKSNKEVETFLRRLSGQSREEYESAEEPSRGICSSQKDILTHIIHYILQELKKGGQNRSFMGVLL